MDLYTSASERFQCRLMHLKGPTKRQERHRPDAVCAKPRRVVVNLEGQQWDPTLSRCSVQAARPVHGLVWDGPQENWCQISGYYFSNCLTRLFRHGLDASLNWLNLGSRFAALQVGGHGKPPVRSCLNLCHFE